MLGRRIVYLLGLLGCCIFYIAYGEWFSAVALAVMAGLPWLSLILTLPALATFRLEPVAPATLERGEEGEVWLVGSSHYPLPPFKGRLRLRWPTTGETRRFRPYQALPTEHCGGITIDISKARVCDYLGLFALPVRRAGKKTVLVRPKPLPVADLPDITKFLPRSWKPKPGGGFAEDHELRLYRPGDGLSQVHWKLTAKTGKLTIREPMEPQRGKLLLTMTLRGTPTELDRKFGRLLWLGTYLTERDAAFELRVLTGEGIQVLTVDGEKSLHRAIDTLLCAPAAKEGSIRDREYAASWQYHIGGEAERHA